MELEEEGTGLKVYEESLTASAWSFGEFLEDAGLESPFAEGRVDDVKAIFEEVLGP